MSILPLLLLVGVSVSRYINDADSDALQPIVTRSKQHRICAELCMSGLGGAVCGSDCVDLVPENIPLQYNTDNTSASSHDIRTRYGLCEVLCSNQLGYPLCQCEKNFPNTTKSTDFIEICAIFCNKYDYRLYGCQKCSLYNTTTKSTSEFSNQSLMLAEKTEVNWDDWCKNMCQNGDGGAACNCDLLPMSLVVDQAKE